MARKVLLAIALSLSCLAWADEGRDARFAAARAAYDAKQYAQAAGMFESLVAEAPQDDRYVYWLGKSCGRQAEQAGWFDAVRLAKRTRKALEKAVALNPANAEAVRDLAQYYDEAPGFLGGDADKAAELRLRLKELETRPTN